MCDKYRSFSEESNKGTFYRTYGTGGGTKDFEIYSRIKETDSWQFCLNGTMKEVLSLSDEDTLFFPLEEARPVRHVRIMILSNHKPLGTGGLQYFSENTVGTPGASYQGEILFGLSEGEMLCSSVSSRDQNF